MKRLTIDLPEGTTFSFIANTPSGNDYILFHVIMDEDKYFGDMVNASTNKTEK